MNQELIRPYSTDGIQLPGLLYTPDVPTNKIVVHIHGMSGNFYEDEFNDNLARVYTNNGYAFLPFNNRGMNYITEMHKENEFVIKGSSYEFFEDCVLDVEGIVNWVKERGYNHIVLEGHSYGCNKAVYYYTQKQDECVKRIVLLAPCDIPKEVENYTGKEYQTCISKAKELIENGKEEELIDFCVFANGKISAKTFYMDLLYNRTCDFFRYREREGKSAILNKIEIPVFIPFGDKDECVLTQPIEEVIDYLQNNLKNCEIKVIKDADHAYTGKYDELEKVIDTYLKENA